MLAHEHISTQSTLAREHVSTQRTSAREHVFSTNEMQFSRLFIIFYLIVLEDLFYDLFANPEFCKLVET